MFSKTNKMGKGNENDTPGGSRNHIAQGTKIKGDISTEGDLRIDGELEGSVDCKGKLVVGNSGKIKGKVRCQNANLSGIIEGVMVVSDMIAMQATGVFSGEITYGKMAVEPGARIEGSLSISGKLKDISSGDVAAAKRASEKTA